MVGSMPQESSTLAGSTIEITAKLQQTGGSLYPRASLDLAEYETRI